ncbi:F-box domain, FBD domain, Leucine-rich repeat domain, L domain-like protein [Artemisia annua]|uniref:F-box domain, FBD domain, Leucine-rich repeat domain, L domain-like protein n=1 Tax=Artemisia annua TaxID=35608 RepID=A0A2U1P0W3_ARTAN|nr:F-box domain, FBD domain, Leucine-rich repeat domain, L domain-like protein [Artemisia annua]
MTPTGQLNFDGTPFGNVGWRVFDAEGCKYIEQVNSKIKIYNRPILQDFRVHFRLKNHHKGDIDEWIQFAVNKKVEFLELNLTDKNQYLNEDPNSYDFPLILSKINRRPLNGTIVEILSLRKLVLKMHIRVGGRALKLKHFEIVGNNSLYSIYLSDFDLVSFTYKGCIIDLRLTNLPTLKEVDLRTDYNVLDQISSCALSLQDLSLDFSYYYHMKGLELDSVPELPNLKKFRLVIGGSKCNFLLDLASILNACPKLESFTLEPFWTSSVTNKRKARGSVIPHEHLKLKIVIDPCHNQRRLPVKTVRKFLMNKVAALSSAKHQLESILPSGVELCIL